MAELSIIISVYNNEKYLRQTIHTVLQQSYRDFELLLIDDGSTDSSLSICQEIAQTDDRIVVIHKENGGVSSARNSGIERAKGMYIAFIDADDCIDSPMYDMMLSALKQTKSDFVGCRIIKEKKYNVLSHEKQSLIQSTYPLELLSKKGYFMDSSLNKIYTRDIIGDTRFDENITYSEDKLFVTEILLKASKAVLLPNEFYHYIQHSGSLSRQNSANLWQGNFQVNKRIYEKITAMNVDSSLQNSTFRGYAKSIIALLRYDVRYRHKKEYNETMASYGEVLHEFLKTTRMPIGKRLEYRSYMQSYFFASLIHYYLKSRRKDGE